MRYVNLYSVSNKKPVCIALLTIVLSLLLSSPVSFAEELESTNFVIEGDSLNPGGNTGDSTNFGLQGEVGPFIGAGTSPNYRTQEGYLPRIQANTPLAPTLANPGGGSYDQLRVTVIPSGNPTDATFVIAVSDDDWATEEYVQLTGYLGSTPVYQTYTNWGGASGYLILGLDQDTYYKARVRAMRGDFTETNWGLESAEVKTGVPYITLETDLLALHLGVLNSNSVSETTTLTLTVNTNAESGYDLKVDDEGNGADGGLDHETSADFITSAGALLSAGTEGYGLQADSSTATIDAAYDYWGTDTVGELILTPTQLASNSVKVTDEDTTVKLKVSISGTTVAGEYLDTLIFTISPNL